jgi:protoporphyrinogen oxidase
LGREFLVRDRQSRIYYRRHFFDYPLKPLTTLKGLGVITGVQIIASYLRARLSPHLHEETFEQWVTNRFGKRLFETFFKAYTEKVWGISCSELRAEWAAQRIKTLTLWSILKNMFWKPGTQITTLIERFHYPRLGPGMMWNTVKQRVEESGGQVLTQSEVVRINHTDHRVDSVVIKQDGETKVIEGSDFISSMPITELIARLDPPPPAEVVNAAATLRYRDFLTVCLIVNKRELFSDNWIYVHDPEIKVSRIQNFKNWSPEMVPDPSQSSLGLEYFCTEGDELWRTNDAELVELGKREAEYVGLLQASDVVDGCVFRVPKSYPIYDSSFRKQLTTVREFVAQLENLQTIGRNGLHRYDNQDHAMLTGVWAARNIMFGEGHNVWSVNTEEEYHEQIRSEVYRDEPVGDGASYDGAGWGPGVIGNFTAEARSTQRT